MTPTEPPGADPGRSAGADRVELATGLAAAAIGLLVLAGSFSIPLGSGYDRIGPRFFPWWVGGGLLLSGLMLSWGARRGRPETPATPTRSAGLGTLVAGLVATVLLLQPAGFVVTSTLLFWLVARAFSSRRPYRDAAVGLVLSTLVHLAFTRGLGLALPGGLLGGLL